MPIGPGRALLRWFRANARPLPWRGPFPRDPYPVLVSEIMLQQTQVERVLAPYRDFMARFPTLEALAAAGIDDVLEAWSGLGYYRRARLLHASVRVLLERGDWPADAAGLRRLPGLGAYTAAAVSAFAFGGSEPPVDGNVSRLASRMRALRLALGSRDLLAAGRQLARAAFDETGTPEVFEAMMELGARVCTPAAPRCPACPWRRSCAARASGAPDGVPLPRENRPRESLLWVALWVTDGLGRVLLRRVPEGGPLAGLWLPPFCAVAGKSDHAHAARDLAATLGLSSPFEAGRVRHTITHRRIEVAVFGAHRLPAVRERGEESRWADPDRPGLGTSSLFAKLRAAAGRVVSRKVATGHFQEDTP